MRVYTDNARTVFGHPNLHRLPAPPQHGLRKARAAVTVFQGHLCLKRPPRRAPHLRGSEPQILYLTSREWRGLRCRFRPLLTSCPPFQFVACLRNHRAQHYTTVFLFSEIALDELSRVSGALSMRNDKLPHFFPRPA